LARNSLGSNEALTLFLTKAPLFLLARAALSPDEGRARRGDYSDSTAQMKIGLLVPFLSAVQSQIGEMARPVAFYRLITTGNVQIP
jgi:hypothetical protein